METKPKILLIYTGGTIGMMKEVETGVLKNFNFSQLLEKIPELNQLDCVIDTVTFKKPIDSATINPETWIEIVTIIETHFELFDGFVVLHGSDTMSYSASALSFLIENLNKPIIFTGSQLPIGDLRTDAKENLITAIQIASLKNENGAVINEVCLYFEYKLYRGNRTTKVNAENFNAFFSPNFPTLIESGVHLKTAPELFLPKTDQKSVRFHKKMNTNVVIIKLFPGIDETILSAIFKIPNLNGIVLETYGIGNAPVDVWFLNLLKTAIKNNLPIVNITQCAIGSVAMGKYESSTALKKIGVICGKDLTTEAAITKLMFLLAQKIPANMFKSVYETSLRGELLD